MKLKDITSAPWNPRGTITPESVKELAESIKTIGLLQPITVWYKGELPNDVTKVCIAGMRRLAALKLAYGENAEVKDAWWTSAPGITEAEAREITITENMHREDVGIMEEADAVAALLDLGNKPETVAAKLGRSVSWVRRRKSLTNLDATWKERASKMDADAIEKIAAYPAEVQASVAKRTGEGYTSWRQLHYYFDDVSHDLDAAKFYTDPCRACPKRTGCEADLFGVVDGKLGACLDAKCFEKKRNAFIEERIAALVGDAETVRVKYSWELPDGASGRRTKKTPCAYVWSNGDDVTVKWSESAKAKAERDAKAKAEKDAKDAAERAKGERRRGIVKALDDFAGDNANEDAMCNIVTEAIARRDGRAIDFAVACVMDSLSTWHSDGEWADIVRAFDGLCGLAGVTDADRDYLLEQCPEDDGADGADGND